MRLNKKLFPIVLVIGLVIAGMVGIKWSGRKNNQHISFSGNIELTEVKIAFKIPGKLVELAVNEGDPVKRDMLIARLDQDQLLNQRDRSRAMLASAEARLSQIQTAIQYQREAVQGQIDMRQAELKQAEIRLQELLSGSRIQEIEQARALADRARTEHSGAEKDWERAKALYNNEDISTARYDQFKTRYESARASLKQAEEHLALVLEGPREEDIESARAQVSKAQAGLRLAKAQELEIRRKEQEAEMAMAEIERAKAELALIESQMKDTMALSPIDGIVLVKAAEAGEILAAGTTVVTIGDLYHPWLRGYINERDLDRVTLGEKVKVITDSGKVFWGRLSFISPEAEFTPKQIQTERERVKLVYRVKIDIENPRGELKLNMPVDAEILYNEP
ncbi:MAG: efflux RND transporter periplasmic adaptor subunit [bacterium]